MTSIGPLARLICAQCARPIPRRNLTTSSARSASAPASAPTPSAPAPLKLAVIGAGPSGFYTASRILSSLPANEPSGRGVEVHMYERLPTPYGLVRYGVAPDHPEVKNCQHKFDELAKDSRFKYFGNVLVTSQPSIPQPPVADQPVPRPRTALSTYTYPHALTVPLSSLLPHYNALLLSYGASLSNPLSSVGGSSSSSHPLANVFPALALVGWYNGHPAFADLPVDLKGIEDVSVVGQGNVALDVARILLKPAHTLEGTDLPDDILHVLSMSTVRHVRSVGRRGPGQVAFTTKEFREILSIPDVAFRGIKGAMMDEAKELVKGDRMRTRILGLMEKDNNHVKEGRKTFTLDFLRSPAAFLGSAEEDPGSRSGRVKQVEWAINQLLPSAPSLPTPPNSQQASVPTGPAGSDGTSRVGLVARPIGETAMTKADMVVESVGYRSEPLGEPLDGRTGWELPFDLSRGRVRNVGGRVTADDGIAIPGIYAAGWVARGPVGVIASTMHDAYSVADQMMADHFASKLTVSPLALAGQPEPGPPAEVLQGLREGKVVDLERWGRIDVAEQERAKRAGKGKPREKFRRVEEMLAVLG